MDDSRSVLQAPAELSDSGRFLPQPQQSSHDFPGFVCRSCGSSDYTVETRPGDEVRLSRLKPYQAVAPGRAPGTHDVYTCAYCPRVYEQAHLRTCDALLGQLLFAARDLAANHIVLERDGDRADLVCSECREVQVSDSYLRHTLTCRSGRVLRILESLMALEAVGLGGNPAATVPAQDAEKGGAL